LIEGEQEGIQAANPSCQERFVDQMFEPRRLQPGQLLRMRVVERQKGRSSAASCNSSVASTVLGSESFIDLGA